MCDPYGKHMTKEEIEFGLTFLRNLVNQNSEPVVIGLTGGEPTLHPLFWSFVIPRLEEIKKQYPKIEIELHTNGSRPVEKSNIYKHHKIFGAVFIGHDMFHRQVRSVSQLFLSDYAELCKNGVTLRSNNWILKGYGLEFPIAVVRGKGRGADLVKNNLIFQEVSVFGYPKLDCSRVSQDYILVNFTPGIINHCGEASHPLEDGSDINNFSQYGDKFNSILEKAIHHALYRVGNNCSQKCMISCVAKRTDYKVPVLVEQKDDKGYD
jgi:hypothetical protein